jgi:hypothetical protein
MTWSYRIVKRRGQEGPEAYAVYEVYYNDQGDITSMTTAPTFPAGETPDELRRHKWAASGGQHFTFHDTRAKATPNATPS